jgi:hypothetical protein
MTVGDPCWRDAAGTAHESLPWRVRLPDGSTRTDPSQWGEDSDVLAATGWGRSVVVDGDIPPPPPPPTPDVFAAGYETSYGWRLGWQADDVALLTGLYVLASRAAELGADQPVIVTDMDGERHSLTLAEYESVMLAYGSARAAASAGGAA